MILALLYGVCLGVGAVVLVAVLAACVFFFGFGALAWAAGAWERARGRM